MNYDEMLEQLKIVEDHCNRSRALGYLIGSTTDAVEMAIHTLKTHRPAIERSMENPRNEAHARRNATKSNPPEMPSNP